MEFETAVLLQKAKNSVSVNLLRWSLKLEVPKPSLLDKFV